MELNFKIDDSSNFLHRKPSSTTFSDWFQGINYPKLSNAPQDDRAPDQILVNHIWTFLLNWPAAVLRLDLVIVVWVLKLQLLPVPANFNRKYPRVLCTVVCSKPPWSSSEKCTATLLSRAWKRTMICTSECYFWSTVHKSVQLYNSLHTY